MKYIHVSKTMVAGSGKTYINPNSEKRNDRKARRCRLISARQQRIERKAWRAEEKAEAKLNAEICNHEANADHAEDVADEREYHAYNRTFEEMNE